VLGRVFQDHSQILKVLIKVS